MDFTVVIPVYNNSGTLRKLYEDIDACFSKFQYSRHILFVNDGSQDSSLETLLALKEEHRDISIVDLEKNYGQPVALLAGYQHARSSYTITISADLQEEDRIIEKYIRCAEAFPDADLIIGQRAKNEDFWIFRKLSVLFYRIIQIKIRDMPDGGFDTCVMADALMQKFIANYYKDIFIQAELLRLSGKVKFVPYKRLRSARQRVQLRSIYFKLNYFFNCIWSVYVKSKKQPKGIGTFYSIKKIY